MYTKTELLDILRAQTKIPNLIFNIYVPPFASIILKALKDNDKIISCSVFCKFNKKSGFLFLLQDRLLFVNYPFAFNRTELYINNIATFSKDVGLWTSINFVDAGGKKYKLFNISEDCADAIINYINSTKSQQKV